MPESKANDGRTEGKACGVLQGICQTEKGGKSALLPGQTAQNACKKDPGTEGRIFKEKQGELPAILQTEERGEIEMKIYVSGAITKDPNFKQNFQKHVQKLRAKGHNVFDPTVWTRENLRLTYEEYMRLDMAMLEMCSAIYMLPGWSVSEGAKRELDRAVELGLKVYYADQNNVPVMQKVYKRRNGRYDWG